MKRSIMLIGIVAFVTFVALILGGAGTNYLYNMVWIASSNEISECLQFVFVSQNCGELLPAYYEGSYWLSHVTFFSILIAGIVFGVKLYKRKITVKNN